MLSGDGDWVIQHTLAGSRTCQQPFASLLLAGTVETNLKNGIPYAAIEHYSIIKGIFNVVSDEISLQIAAMLVSF